MHELKWRCIKHCFYNKKLLLHLKATNIKCHAVSQPSERIQILTVKIVSVDGW